MTFVHEKQFLEFHAKKVKNKRILCKGRGERREIMINENLKLNSYIKLFKLSNKLNSNFSVISNEGLIISE